MCGRYYIDEAMFREIEDLLQTLCGSQTGSINMGLRGKGENVRTGDIRPGDQAPVLVRTMDGIRLVQQRWGLPVPEAHGKGLIFNARAETALEKRMFQDGVLRRRAVIPARWFYEWNRAKEKITFYQETGSVLYLAGFFNQYEEGNRFVILTTDANASMRATHDRMPLILEQHEIPEWLEAIEERVMLEQTLKKVPGELQKRADYEQLSFL